MIGVGSYMEEVGRTYGKLPQRDSGEYDKALKFREEEKRRVAALADEHGELTLANRRLQAALNHRDDWIRKTSTKLEEINSKIKASHASSTSSRGRVSGLQPPPPEDNPVQEEVQPADGVDLASPTEGVGASGRETDGVEREADPKPDQVEQEPVH